jgi:hypothetical protein
MIFWLVISGKISTVRLQFSDRIRLMCSFAVTDCLGSPSESANENKYTVLAMYKHLVVGAVLTLPMSLQEIYIAYLVVRSGWEGEAIATYVLPHSTLDHTDTLTLERSMLYHLITRQPGKDITLHVSVTNPAMVSSFLRSTFGIPSTQVIRFALPDAAFSHSVHY